MAWIYNHHLGLGYTIGWANRQHCSGFLLILLLVAALSQTRLAKLFVQQTHPRCAAVIPPATACIHAYIYIS